VSALAHYLEDEGIPTVTISLIRPQTENTKPPRALWVPFELGRPFGPPNDPAFQKRVILAALQLLDRESGPVIIEDFPDDDPRAQPDPAWHPPVSLSPPSTARLRRSRRGWRRKSLCCGALTTVGSPNTAARRSG
jgi:hypothetical protein